MTDVIVLDSRPLRIEDVLAVANGTKRLVLSYDASFVDRMRQGREALDALRRDGVVVYGVTTGVGDSCGREIPPALADSFARNLMRFHGCGFGEMLDEQTGRAVLVVRLASLCSGWSGVRYELLEQLAALLEHGITPRIPAEGSVGASGDLTPLSYVAATVAGERDVYYQGAVRSAAEARTQVGLTDFSLKAKEAIAIMNGTSVMTAIACRAFSRAARVLRLGTGLTALVVEALQVNKGHFDERLFAQKPHPGQLDVARRMASWVRYSQGYRHDPAIRIQATYAVRCAPHILGVLADALPFFRTIIETEINSTNDNPLIDPDTREVLHGGNFYGGHIAFAMDSLKNLVANCADLFDRQIALLVNERSNNGLPMNLSGMLGEEAVIHHGFKAVHITASACAAEALKGTLPASVFSRSTESHNQDKVSMGTIAARDCVRVLELTEQVLSCTLLAAAQAIDLRIRAGALQCSDLHTDLQEMLSQIRQISPILEEDRALEPDLREMVGRIERGLLDVPWGEDG